jgi:hypothetical protein
MDRAIDNFTKDDIARWMAKDACRDFGYRFLALVDDVSSDGPVQGFTYVEPGQSTAAPNWVSFKKACSQIWDGTPEGHSPTPPDEPQHANGGN